MGTTSTCPSLQYSSSEDKRSAAVQLCYAFLYQILVGFIIIVCNEGLKEGKTRSPNGFSVPSS